MKCLHNLKRKFFDETIPLSNRLLTIILSCVILGTLIGLIPMIFGITKGWWLNFLMMTLAVIAQIINIVFKKYDAATMFLSLTGLLIVMPCMYFFQGGIASGVPFWFLFGILTAFIMNEGWKRYISVILGLIFFVACFIIEYYCPEYVDTLPTRESIYLDIVIGFVSTVVIFLIMLDIYLKAYKKKRDRLDYALHYDALTGIENRYAYEKYLKDLTKKPFSRSLAFISADVNELKMINDTLGHSAGDELLIGAAKVFSDTFEPYGKVFRTGGDEFQAVILQTKGLAEIHQTFETNMKKWTGKQVQELHISIGYASSVDSDTENYYDISKAADKAMYKDKAAYYEKKGVNRRSYN